MLPVVLLGGLNMVRALGLAGSRSSSPPPSADARDGLALLRGRDRLPPLADRAAVVETLVPPGGNSPSSTARRMPLFYGNDDRLALVQDYRAALEPHFLLLLNEPALGDALLAKDRFQALAERRGLPVPRRSRWEALDAASAARCWSSRRARSTGTIRACASGSSAAPARRASSRAAREARADPVVAQLADAAHLPGVRARRRRRASGRSTASPTRGEVLAWFVGRKIRTYPALTGESSFIELAHDERLVDARPRRRRAPAA